MTNVSDVISIAEYFKQNELQKKIFDTIARSSTISGWALAKTLQIGPDEVQTYLNDLRQKGLIQADGPDLDSYFYLSALGFRFGSFVS